MSLNLNHVTLAGHLTRNPEGKVLPGGSTVAKFGLACNRTFKDAAGNKREEVTFIDVETWGRTADAVLQYLVKGRPLYVEGRLKLDQWEDAQGQKRQRLSVVAESIQFLGSKPMAADGQAAPTGDAPATSPAGAPAASRAVPPPLDDEPPF